MHALQGMTGGPCWGAPAAAAAAATCRILAMASASATVWSQDTAGPAGIMITSLAGAALLDGGAAASLRRAWALAGFAQLLSSKANVSQARVKPRATHEAGHVGCRRCGFCFGLMPWLVDRQSCCGLLQPCYV